MKKTKTNVAKACIHLIWEITLALALVEEAVVVRGIVTALSGVADKVEASAGVLATPHQLAFAGALVLADLVEAPVPVGTVDIVVVQLVVLGGVVLIVKVHKLELARQADGAVELAVQVWLVSTRTT